LAARLAAGAVRAQGKRSALSGLGSGLKSGPEASSGEEDGGEVVAG
jgi:hypothetical protein